MNRRPAPSRGGTTLMLAAGLFTAMTIGSAMAQSADDAKDVLRAMTDYLAKQERLSFDYQTSVEVVSPEFEKLEFISSGSVSMERPNKLRVTRRGGFADIELVFDGTNLTVHGKDENVYAQIKAPGSISEMHEKLEGAGLHFPLGDLFAPDAFDALTANASQARHIASATVGGLDAEYLAFRAPDFDWQIWIAEGKDPFPLRYVITSKHIAQAPQYRVEITNWKTGNSVAATDFNFTPGTTRKVELSDLKMLDDLPDATSVGEP